MGTITSEKTLSKDTNIGPSPHPNLGWGLSNFAGTDRYAVLRYLGSGSFGEVFEAFDCERRCRVALKRPHDISAGGLYYFKREFRSLVDVVHPNLVELYELVGDQEKWFFTMELVEGVSFRKFLRPESSEKKLGSPGAASTSGSGGYWPLLKTQGSFLTPPSLQVEEAPWHEAPESRVDISPFSDFEKLRHLLRQLAEGLMAIHRAGKLHRDIKPSNVLVTPAGHLVIMDFGLVVEVVRGGDDENAATWLVGTPSYMAPEQVESSHQRGSEASDWYSVGVMLYEVLVGRQPFQGSVLEIMRGKVERDPDPPSLFFDGIPPELERLCMGLLCRDPKVRLSGRDILNATMNAGGQRLESHDLRESPSTLQSVGREREMAELVEAAEVVRGGEAVLVRLHGGSGTGKTHLLKNFVQETQEQYPGAVLLFGRCYEQESVPYKALDPVIDDLSRYLRRLQRDKSEHLVPRHAYALTRLFPVLHRIDQLAINALPPAMAVQDARTLRRLASLALRDLLHKIGEEQLLVMIIDDLQWGDLDSVHLIQDLLGSPNAPPMLLVTCYRTEEETTSPALMELFRQKLKVTTREIVLGDMSPSDSERLALSLLNPDLSNAISLAKWIARETGGNPFFISELAYQSRTGKQSPGGSTGDSLYDSIQKRVASLPPEIKRITEILSLAGHPLSWEVVKLAAGVTDEHLPPATLIKAGRLIRNRAIPGHIALEIYHDFVGRAVTAGMGSTRIRELRLRVADALESIGEVKLETLARHFLLVGEIKKAAHYTALAAEEAAGSLAFKGSAELYRRSISLRDPEDPEIPALLLKMADMLANAGRGCEAAEHYLDLSGRLSGIDSLKLRRRAAEEFFRSGHFDQGVVTLEPVLKTLGLRSSRVGLRARLVSYYFSLRLQLRGLSFRERSASEVPIEELELVDTCWTAVQGLGTAALMRGMDLQTQHLLLALRVGEPTRVIRALAHQTLHEAMQGSSNHGRAEMYQSLSISLAVKHGDPRLVGQALMASGMASFMQGRWRAAVNLLERAKCVFVDECVGVAAEIQQVNHNLLSGHFLLGHFDELERVHPGLLKDAEERGDLLAEANLKTGYALFHHLAKDHVETSRTHLARAMEIWSSAEFHSQHWQAMVLEGAISLYVGEPEKAWESLERHWKRLKASRLLRVRYIAVSCEEHRARTSLAYARVCQPGSVEWKKAMRFARPAIRAVRKSHTDYGDATFFKLKGIEAVVLGEHKQAISWFGRAEQAYLKCDMPVHLAVVQWCRGRLLGVEGAKLLQEAERWMQEHGIVKPSKYTAVQAPCFECERAD